MATIVQEQVHVILKLNIEVKAVITDFLLILSLQTMRATETEVLVSILGDDLSLGAELASELWDAKVKAEYMLDKRLM